MNNSSLAKLTPKSRTPRKVVKPPLIKGFKPYGLNSGKSAKPYINLLFEEYEALKLCDFDHFNHQDASELMKVSRPTFTRIYGSALQKIAQAFVEGRGIMIQGGHVYFDTDWYYCQTCRSNFNRPEKEIKAVFCPSCGEGEILPA